MGNKNLLYYGDNLDILRRYIKDETIDLVYLDPPFKSTKDYNVLFAEQNGSRSFAQKCLTNPGYEKATLLLRQEPAPPLHTPSR